RGDLANAKALADARRARPRRFGSGFLLRGHVARGDERLARRRASLQGRRVIASIRLCDRRALAAALARAVDRQLSLPGLGADVSRRASAFRRGWSRPDALWTALRGDA